MSFGMEQKFLFLVKMKNREDVMDQMTRCPKCGKRMIPLVTICGRTDFQCISCDDPAMRWAESPSTAPEKPIAAERVQSTPHAFELELSAARR
jgi:tRNA(Ile2) C34 agmatinyltransferase TiaS